MSTLVNPAVDQEKIKALANGLVKGLDGCTEIEVVYTLAFALASASERTGCNADDVVDVLRRLVDQMRTNRGGRGGRDRVQVVSPEQFTAIAKRFGVKFD